MNIPLAPTKNQLAKLKEDVIKTFQKGDSAWNTGATVEEKKQGLNIILQGLKIMKAWIQNECDEEMIPFLNFQYQARYDDVKQKLIYLEDYKKGEYFQQNSINFSEPNFESQSEPNLEVHFETMVRYKPNVKWSEIMGLDNIKKCLQETIVVPLRFPQLFQGGRKPWKCILLYGATGTGKKLLAKACGTDLNCTFLSVELAYLISLYERGSENQLKLIFQFAKEQKPTIIFIDEIDILCLNQNEIQKKMLSQLLVQIDEIQSSSENQIQVLCTSNRPWALNQILRRFERRIYIPLPDLDTRECMIKSSLSKTKNKITAEQLKTIANQTEGYSGSDISVLVREAVYEPVRRLQTAEKFKEVYVDGKKKWTPVSITDEGTPMNFLTLNQNDIELPDVSYADFQQVLKQLKQSISKQELKEYEKWTKEFGQEE